MATFEQAISTSRLPLKEVQGAAITPPVPLFSPCNNWRPTAAQDADLDRTQPMRTGAMDDFMQKARAPMATEEFERILSSEREFWFNSYHQQVRSLEETIDSMREEAAAKCEALSGALGEMRAQGEREAAAGAARAALTEAAVAELREMLQEERRLREREPPAASSAALAELRAEVGQLKAASSSLPADAASGGEAIAQLRAEVAKLQSSAVGQQEPILHLAQLSGHLSADLEQSREAAEKALEELRAELRAEVRLLTETSKAQQQAHQHVAEAVAGLEQTQRAVELDQTTRSVSTERPVSERDLEVHEEAIVDLRMEVSKLRAGRLELAEDFDQLRAALENTNQRVVDLAQAGAAPQRGGDAEMQIGSLHRLLQDQRRELTMLSSELGSVRDKHAASDADRGQWRSVSDRMAEIETQLAAQVAAHAAMPGPSAPAAQDLDATVPTQRRPQSPLCSERARPDASEARRMAQQPNVDAATDHSESADAHSGLKDNLEGVVAAVQKLEKVLDDKRQQQRRQVQAQPVAAAPVAVAVPVPAVPAGWVVPQTVVAAAPAVAHVGTPRAHARPGTVVVGPRTPLVVHRR